MHVPALVRVEDQPALAAGAEVEPDSIAGALVELLPRVLDFAGMFGSPVSGPPFTRLLGFAAGGRIRIETGVPTLDPLPSGAGVSSIVLPGGEAVSLLHEGPLETLHLAHALLDEWFEQTGRQPAAPRLESYLSGPGEEPDPARWRTLIIQVLEP